MIERGYVKFPDFAIIVCEAYIEKGCLVGPMKKMEVGDLIRYCGSGCDGYLCMIDRLEPCPDNNGFMADFHTVTEDELHIHNIMKA